MAEKPSNVVLNFKMDGQVQYAKTIRDINAIMNAAAKEYRNHVNAMDKDASATQKLSAEKKKLEIQMEAAKERTKMLRVQYDEMAKSSKTTTGQLAAMHGKLLDSENAEMSLERAMQRVNEGLSNQTEESRKAQEAMDKLKQESSGLENQTEKLNAEYKLQEAQLGSNAKESEKLALKTEHLNKQHELAVEQVRNHEQQLELAKQQYGENSTEVDNYERQLIEARTAEQELTNEIRTTSSQLREQESVLRQTSETLGKVGDKMKDVGKDLTKKVTAPIIGVATIAAKIGSDFEAGMSEVAAISGAVGGDLQALEDKAREMGATTQFSATQAAEALNYMALAGWDTTQMLSGIDGVMALAAASGEDLGRVSDIVTDGLSAFGLAAEDSARFADVLAAASANANTDVSGLGGAFEYVAPVAGALGFTIEDTALAIGLMSNAGIKGQKAGTALRTMMTNLAKPTKAMQKEMSKLGVSLTDSEGNMKTFDTIMQELQGSFGGLSEAQQASSAATIFGKEAMSGALAVINTSEADYNKLAEAINTSEGAAKRMADTMTDNLQGRLKEMKSALEDVAITIFKNLQPTLEKLVGVVQSAADKFSNLSPSTQNTIIALAGIAAAIGPVIFIVGTLISSLGTIFGALATVSSAIAVVTTGAAVATPAIGALATVFTVLTGPVGLIIAGLALVSVGVFALVKHLKKDAIPEVERFGDGISDATQQAVGAFLDMNDQIDVSLKELSWGSKAVTQEMADELTTTFSSMASQITGELKSEQDEQLAIMKEYYANSKLYGDESRDATLKAIEDKYEEQQAFINNGEKIISEILAIAAEENRELTDSEYSQINRIKEGWIEKGINALSQNELEAKSIMERMKANSEDLTAQQAAEVVKNSKVQRDGVIEAAEEQYDQTVQAIIKQRDEMGTISETQANIMILEAQRQRDGVIVSAEETFSNVIGIAKEQAGEHVNLIDWETGEILSKWDIFKTDFINLHVAIWDKGKELWENGSKMFKEQFQKMWDASVEFGEKIRKTVIEKWSEAQKFLTDIDLKQIGMDIIMGLVGGINDKMIAVAEAIAGITNKIKSVFKKEMDTHSPSKVMEKGGEDVGEGVAIGIESKETRVGQAMQSLTKVITEVSQQNADEVTKIADEAEKKRTAIQKDYANKRAELDRKTAQSSQSALKTTKNKKGQIVTTGEQKVYKIRQDASAKLKKLTDDEQKALAKINNKAWADMQKKESELSKSRLESIKLYIADKKSMEQLSLIDEAEIWAASTKLFTDGTKEKVEAQKSYRTAYEAINKELVSVNKQFSDEMQKINDDLAKSEQALNDEYNRAYSSRIADITNFAGIFDEFVLKFDGSGQTLLNNLKSQVTGLEDWRGTLDSLWGKIDDQALMEELEAMGPKALGELQALNSLSESELELYVELYNQKFSHAREQASHELEGLKDDTEVKITELRKAANKKLDELQKDWIRAVRKITQTTTDEFKSLGSIGRQAGQNLLDGLSSMEGALVAKAQSIAAAVNAAMQGALGGGGGEPSVNTMSFDTKWNAKGGIFTQPTIFGASGGKLQGAGEAGPEAVLPLNAETLGTIGKAIAKTMGGSPITINSRDDAESIARAVDRVERRNAFRMG